MCVIEQAYDWILAMCFAAFSWTGVESLLTKAQKKRCHLDQTGLANEGFLHGQVNFFLAGPKGKIPRG